MTPEHDSAFALPPDLADMERYLRSGETAAPAKLLDRIQATRVQPALVSSSVELRRTTRLRPMVALMGLASLAAAIIYALGSGSGIRETSAGAQPIAGGRAQQPASSPTDDVSRLLQPWPMVAHAQTVVRSDQVRGAGAPLEPGARARLSPSLRRFERVSRTANGRTVARTQIEVQLDSINYRGRALWLLTTRILDQTGAGQPQVDSISLEPRALLPVQRRLHVASVNRYFRFTPRRAEATDTMPEHFFEETMLTQRLSLWAPQSTGGYAYSVYSLDPTQTLVLSEAHLQLLLRTLPISRDWTMHVALTTLNDRHFPRRDVTGLALRTVAIDTLASPTGPTPCYRVELDYGARPDIWWISVATGEFVRGVRTTSDPVTTETTTLERISPLRR